MRSNGAHVSPADIVYTWRVDDTVQTRASGVGRTTFTTVSPFFNNSYRLSVTTTSRDGSLVAETSTVITPRKPEIVFYELSPLAGLLDERALVDSYPFVREEVAVRAYPLHITDPQALIPQWALNGTALTIDTGDPFLAVFRKTGSGSGTYRVDLSFTHPVDFLKRGGSTFLLTF